MVSSRSFVVILVAKFPAFNLKAPARLGFNSLPWRERQKQATDDSKS